MIINWKAFGSFSPHSLKKGILLFFHEPMDRGDLRMTQCHYYVVNCQLVPKIGEIGL